MTNLPTPAEVAELRRLANGGFTQAIDPDRILSICNAVDRLREVAVIAEDLHQSGTSARPLGVIRERWNDAEARWLAIRDTVMGKEGDRAD